MVGNQQPTKFNHVCNESSKPGGHLANPPESLCQSRTQRCHEKVTRNNDGKQTALDGGISLSACKGE